MYTKEEGKGREGVKQLVSQFTSLQININYSLKAVTEELPLRSLLLPHSTSN